VEAGPTGRAIAVNSRRRGRPEGRSAPGRAQHKPSTHRAGKAGRSAAPVCRCAAFFACAPHGGPRVPSRHPAFPAPLNPRGWSGDAKLGRDSPREREAAFAFTRSLQGARATSLDRFSATSPAPRRPRPSRSSPPAASRPGGGANAVCAGRGKGDFVLCKRERLCYTQPRANAGSPFSSVAQR
jgi:hypothetical protein